VDLNEVTTATAIDNILSQYSFLGVHLDEFREKDTDSSKINSIRNSFNRASKENGTIYTHKITRNVSPRTTPIITGENSTTDAATRSRFIQLTMSGENRLPIGDRTQQARNFARFQRLSPQLHRIGRFIFRNREDFTKIVINEIKTFLEAEDVCTSIHNQRIRLSYGTAYAATLATKQLLSHETLEMNNLRNFTLNFADEAQ